jgi:hypothetical protein
MINQSDEERQALPAKPSDTKAPVDQSSSNTSAYRILIERRQSEPPSSERKRVVRVFNEKGARRVIYRNDF